MGNTGKYGELVESAGERRRIQNKRRRHRHVSGSAPSQMLAARKRLRICHQPGPVTARSPEVSTPRHPPPSPCSDRQQRSVGDSDGRSRKTDVLPQTSDLSLNPQSDKVGMLTTPSHLIALTLRRRHSSTLVWSCDADSARYSGLADRAREASRCPLLVRDPAAGPDLEEAHGRSASNQASMLALLFIYLHFSPRCVSWAR